MRKGLGFIMILVVVSLLFTVLTRLHDSRLEGSDIQFKDDLRRQQRTESSQSIGYQSFEAPEPPEIEWVRRWGADCYDMARSVVQTSDGGYAIAGVIDCWNIPPWGMYSWLIKTDADGNMQWNKTYEDAGWACSVVETSEGGYVLAGGRVDFWLVKTDSDGDAQWSKRYGATDYSEFPNSMVSTSDGGYAIAGERAPHATTEVNDFWLVKTDADGNMQWNKTYGGADNDRAYSVVQTSDGGYAIAGYGFANLIKTDALGNLLWNKTYGGGTVFSVVQTLDGGYALTGEGKSLIKTDSDGNVQWSKTYALYSYDLIQTLDGGYAISGSESGGYKLLMVKTDANGNMQWNITYSNGRGSSVVQTLDGGYAIAGHYYGTYDFLFMKLAPDTVDDLTIIHVEPVQVVWEDQVPEGETKSLIKDKKTGIWIRVYSSFTETIWTDIQIDYDFGSKRYTETGPTGTGIPIEPGWNTFYLPGGPRKSPWHPAWIPPNNPPWLFWRDTGIDNNIKVIIDPHNKIAETNEDNNEIVATKKFVESNWLKILFVPLYFPHLGEVPFYPAGYFNDVIDFLLATYPVPDNRLFRFMRPPRSWQGAVPADSDEDWLYNEVVKDISKQAKLAGFDRVVILVKDLGRLTNNPGLLGSAIGMLRNPEDRVPVVIDVDDTDVETVAHEIGHTYYLWHPHDIGTKIGSVLHPPLAQRFWVARRDYDAVRASSTFMSYDNIDIDPSTPQIEGTNPRLWIDKRRFDTDPKTWIDLSQYGLHGTWQWNLFDQLATSTDPEIVVLCGTLFSNGTASIEPWYHLLQGTTDLEPGANGTHSIVLLDNQHQVISQIGFNVSFSYLREINGTYAEAKTDAAPFIFNVPYKNGTSVIKIQNSTGYVLASRTISSNPPIVNVTFPNGGETLEACLNYMITWEALDLDGDTLTYTVAYSEDGGENWAPLAVDLAENSYVWSTSYLSGGANYIVRVIASDGVSAGEDISDNPFTVLVHDVAITNVTPSKTVVGQGYSMNITVTVENQGNFAETFNVTAYYNETAITLPDGKNYTTTTLTGGNYTTLTIPWNTTGTAKGNYTITAKAAPIPGETDTTDNNLTDGIVLITVPGDVNGDCVVDMADISMTIEAFMTYPGDPKWDPNCDVNCDGVVDMADISIAIDNFTKTCADP